MPMKMKRTLKQVSLTSVTEWIRVSFAVAFKTREGI